MPNVAKLKPFDKIEIIRKITGFTPAQKHLLLLLATHLGTHNFCHPSLSTLMIESGMSRTAVADNLKKLIAVNVLIKLPPSHGYKSNRYLINFELLVAQDYQCSSLGLLDWYTRTTRLVAQDYPKEQLNKIKRKEKKPFTQKSQEKRKEKASQAVAEIRKLCKLKTMGIKQ